MIQNVLRNGNISEIYKNATTLLKKKNSDSQINVPSMTTLSLHKFISDVHQNNTIIERKKINGAVLYQAINKKPNQQRNKTTEIPQDFYPYLSFYFKIKEDEHGFKKELLRIFSYILLVLKTKSFKNKPPQAMGFKRNVKFGLFPTPNQENESNNAKNLHFDLAIKKSI